MTEILIETGELSVFSLKNHFSLSATIVSIILHRRLVRAIGRYEFGELLSLPGSNIGMIMEWRHASGTTPSIQDLLMILGAAGESYRPDASLARNSFRRFLVPLLFCDGWLSLILPV